MSEDWKANVSQAIRDQRKRNGRPGTVFGRELRPLQLTATLRFVRYVDEAARTLGVNRSTFIRRAAAVVAAAVLGTDVRVILNESPKAAGYGEQRLRVADGGQRDDGLGIEQWCPHRGCDGDHLRHPEG